MSEVDDLIWKLKNTARKNYFLYMQAGSEYSCGHNLQEYIHPDKASYGRHFNEAMEQLEQIDPSCPKGVRL